MVSVALSKNGHQQGKKLTSAKFCDKWLPSSFLRLTDTGQA